MSELMKAQTTSGFVEFSLRVEKAQADKVETALRALLAILPAPQVDDEERLYTVEEAFGPREPGRMIRGYRSREGLTQADLAARLDTTRTVVSDMENGRRPVSAKMARRLAEVFGSSPRMFRTETE